MRNRGPKTLSPTTAPPRIPVAWSELIDKITILEIKSERILDVAAVANVRKELALLRQASLVVDRRDGKKAFYSLRTELEAGHVAGKIVLTMP